MVKGEIDDFFGHLGLTTSAIKTYEKCTKK